MPRALAGAERQEAAAAGRAAHLYGGASGGAGSSSGAFGAFGAGTGGCQWRRRVFRCFPSSEDAWTISTS